jgi:hypothetical protein
MAEEVSMTEGTVNSQITDSVTQTIAAVLGNSSAETKSMLDTLMAETVGMAMYNAVNNQHNAQMVSNASTTAACARMLKTPFPAPPSVRVSVPTVTAVTPVPIPLAPTSAQVQVTGAAFDPDLTVELTASGKKIAVLSGSAQLIGVTPTGFSFSNSIFTAEGTYGMQIRNPDGGTSASVSLSVLAQAPSISGVTSVTGSITVAGANFQPNLSVAVVNQNGVPVSGPVVSAITSGGFTVKFSVALAAGLYGITVTNPDGRSSSNYLFSVAAA